MRLHLVISILFVCILFAAFGVNAQTGAAKGKGRLKGKVTDTKGNPLEGVTVHFSSGELKTSFDLKTNNKGEFGIAGIAGVNWDIDFTKDGYKTEKISYHVSELSYNKPVEVHLEPAANAPPTAAAAKTPGYDLVQQGNDLLAKKDQAGAIAKFQAAMQVNPNLYKLNADIGNIYMDMNQPDKAAEAYRQFLAKEAANMDVRIDLAGALLKKGDLEAAKKELASLNIDTVTDAGALYNLGASLYNAKLIEEAIKYWQKSATLDPKNADTHLQLGFAYYAQQKSDLAKQEFQKVIELDPNSENAKSAKEMLDTIK